jgi:hypothetical protein
LRAEFATLLHGWSPFAPRVRFGKLSSSARPAVSSHLKPHQFCGVYGRPEGRPLQKDEFFRSL